MTTAGDDEPVPRLPRGRGLKLSTPALFRIAITLCLLVMIVIMQKPCAVAVGKFVGGFGDQGSAGGSAMPKPGTVDQPGVAVPNAESYEHIGSNMSDAEIKAAIERAKARAHAGSAAPGSAAPAPAP